ncbi:MAG: PhzF family phenazine biosynthesis protein [Thalassobaculum sp.]|uniref:PhzF family phenazine biosynthesis protein n=1 Tax=Thalassobaculum sp. TaxID=2022740 RepID=UPI0032ED1F49
MTLAFETVDVFTDTAFGGNPLAVVFGGEDLSGEAMQRIAREFNYSETTFVLPPADPANTARVRIFSTKREMPFAGHPNVGTATVLAWRGEAFGRRLGDRLVFEEIAGLVPIAVQSDGGRPVGAMLTAPAALSTGAEATVEDVAACLGLTPADIRTDTHRPIVASGGLPFLVAELTDRAALERSRPDTAGFASAATVVPHGAILSYVRTGGPNTGGTDTVDIRARMFAPIRNVAEDPATGSANVALMGLLASLQATPGTLVRRIAQGVEMGRPSLLEGEADWRDGKVTAIRMGGRCAPVMRGELLAW